MKSGQKVYLAGCFDDYLEIRKVQGLLQTYGFEITYDWTIRAEKTITERNNMFNNMRMNDTLKQDAKLDMNGVYEADWTIFIITKKDYVYRGTFCELGASIMRDILRDKIGHTIILSNKNEDSYAKTLCFYHHPNIVHVNTIEEAVSILH
jgi:nucleoside 2-deoxyribosyltransferase